MKAVTMEEIFKELIENEEKDIDTVVFNIKKACERYLEDKNGSNILSIIDRAEELKTSRARISAFRYAKQELKEDL